MHSRVSMLPDSAGESAPSPRAGQVQDEPAAAMPGLVSGHPRRTIGLTSRGLTKVERISEFLDADTVYLKRRISSFWRDDVGSCDQLAGWGKKPTSKRAQQIAGKFGLPFVALEDGFLRSVGSGSEDSPLSIVVDEIGIYYDATAPSTLERLIATPLSPAQTERAKRIMNAWRDGRVSKYNKARDYDGILPQRFVLVIDQTFNDHSIQFGLADASSFERMLEAAIRENPDSTILVKTHPDVWAGTKRGHFNLRSIKQLPRLEVLAADCHPAGLIERAETVYTVTSQVGFEALIWGKPVRCFGMPFYAGWGLTVDTIPSPDRRGKASLEQLVHASLVSYPRYIDPESGKRCEVEAVIEHLAQQRKMRSRFPETLHAAGFSAWKRPMIRDFMAGTRLDFPKRRHKIPSGATVAIWGNVPDASVPDDATLIRVEDGFLRSVGLGAELRRSLSLALDPVGIYYDSSRPSALENILMSTDFDPALLSRARALRERLVAERLSKYNLDAQPWKRPDTRGPVILVPGQVESDASIRFGAPEIRRNIDLLRAVRKDRPEAHIVYKPHPDVVAGLRAEGEDEARAAQECDEIVMNGSVVQMLDHVDEVHLLTSLTGFEALIRGRSVTCYGQPFYSGWGLTSDVVPVERRTRRLCLDELVAGCLILYPTYVSRTSGRFITPEQAVDSLVRWRESGDGAISPSHKALRLGARIERLFLSPLAWLRAGR
jgi:capsular polysaccharide export protein